MSELREECYKCLNNQSCSGLADYGSIVCMTTRKFKMPRNNEEDSVYATKFAVMQQQINEKDKRIKELEEHLKKYYDGELYTAKQLKQIEENQKKYFINKQKVKEGLERIEDYFYRLNGPDEDIEYIRNVKKELLEEK